MGVVNNETSPVWLSWASPPLAAAMWAPRYFWMALGTPSPVQVFQGCHWQSCNLRAPLYNVTPKPTCQLLSRLADKRYNVIDYFWSIFYFKFSLK